MRTLSLVIALTLTACASPTWVKEEMTAEARDRDLAECELEAEKATGSMPSGIARGIRLADIETRCMRLRGYRTR